MATRAKGGTRTKSTKAARAEERARLRKRLSELAYEDGRIKRGTVGLALSGGGYRAALFHLGTLWRLNELGWLRKLTEVTSVSGGSIVAAYLAVRWSELEFDPETGVARNFDDAFIEPMRDMFGTTIDIQTIGRGLLNPVGSARGRMEGEEMADSAVDLIGEAANALGGKAARSVAKSFARPFGAVLGMGVDAAAAAWDALNPFPTPSEELIEAYDEKLFDGKTLQDLPDPEAGDPCFTLYATNMQTGVSVRMTRRRVLDYRLGEVEKPDIPLARAVAASSGFPPFYAPVEIKIAPERWSPGKDADLWRRTELRERMDLADGAVYDNLGLTALVQKRCETILVSDAGDAIDVVDALPFDWLSQAVRTLLIAMDQSNKLRFGKLIEEYRRGERKGAYWGISGPIKKRLEAEGKKPELLLDSEETRELGNMRTRLNRFTDEEQEKLINWGYALTDARMRRWVVSRDSPGSLPFPGRLEQPRRPVRRP